MPRLKTPQLLERIAKGDFDKVVLKGSQFGTFYLLLECADGSFIHENLDGRLKEYPHADNALNWLKRKSGVKEVLVDIELWQADAKC
jgi:hypothetical protein